jgi:osmotically-inducible protein OsmY
MQFWFGFLIGAGAVMLWQYRQQQRQALVEQVRWALQANPRTRLVNIDVAWEDGAIVLRGQTDRPEVRQAAEEIARGIPGVTAVRNEIVVTTPGGLTTGEAPA